MVQPWCTVDDVVPLLQQSVSPDVIQPYVEQATSVLYILSGRTYKGSSTVTVNETVNRRGYVILTDWQPVRSVTALTIDGVTLDVQLSRGGTYVDVGQLYRGKTAVLTLAVGQAPPTAGRRAAAALAAEMVRGDPRYESTGATDTRPAFRLTSISRQGVTYNYVDPTELVDSGMTGIYDVDLFLRTTNPSGAHYQPKVVTA